MVYYLRNDKNETIVDLELYCTQEEEYKYVDLSVTIMIDKYSEYLLNNVTEYPAIIKAFSNIQNLRGWLHEFYFTMHENSWDQIDDLRTEIKRLLEFYSKVLKLNLVTD